MLKAPPTITPQGKVIINIILLKMLFQCVQFWFVNISNRLFKPYKPVAKQTKLFIMICFSFTSIRIHHEGHKCEEHNPYEKKEQERNNRFDSSGDQY